MALASPSNTSRWDLCPSCSSPTDSPPPTSQLGINCARAGVARKTKEAEHILANLEKEGVEIDDRITSIIDDEIAKIKAKAEREKIIHKLKRTGRLVGLTLSTAALAFFLGGDIYEKVLNAHIDMLYGED